MQVEEFLECSAARFPDKLALIAGSRRVTYRDLDCQANRLAYSLVELGVRRGDRVDRHRAVPPRPRAGPGCAALRC